MDRDDPVNVVIAGGGVAALEAALALRALSEDRFEVELLAPQPHFWYRPLAVAEPFALGEARHFELSQLASRAGATFSPGALVSVDAPRHLAYTSAGGAVPYTALLIACGAEPKPAIDGALTFRGPADTARIEHLLAEIEAGDVQRVVFAVPAGAVWSLPAYELALMTAAWLTARGITGVELGLVTPEERPLHVFGRTASDAVRELLDERGIALYTRSCPAEARDGELLLVADGIVMADRVVALPRLQGPHIGGVPQTFEGFISVDEHGRVTGMPDVYAAGDITSFPVKQGGIAAQQAEAAAEAIAASVGVELTPRPFRPVLRGLLLTGAEARYLRHDLADEGGEASTVSLEPLWWPPAKIVGRHLAPFLASLDDVEAPLEVPEELGGVPIEIELDAGAVDRAAESRRDRVLEAVVEDALRDADAPRVAEVMSSELLVVAPEDTLGEVAEKMGDLDVGSAIVAEYGRLIGIVTSRDMLRAFAGRVHSSEARVRQWMTAEPIAVSALTTIEAATLLMTEHRIHHLPVVESERPVGVVAMRDIARPAGLVARSRLESGSVTTSPGELTPRRDERAPPR
jgi:sulfide:quinone oxidoreductase